MNADQESLAAIELERHRPQMLYAEKQLLKKREYEALALSLAKRSRLRLWVSVGAAAFCGVSGSWFWVAMGFAILYAAVLDYRHTQRTLTTIQALFGADEPAKPS